MSAARTGHVLYSTPDVDVVNYPPHMPGYFDLYGLRVRTANGRAHEATLSIAELRALRDFLNRLDGLA